MAKYVIRYLLDGDGKVPVFVDDGGYYPNGYELIGLSVDDEQRYLPSTVQKLTKTELIAWIQAVATDLSDNPLNEGQSTSAANSFLSAMGIPDYE